MNERLLCRLHELPDGGARGLLRQGNDDGVFAVRRGSRVQVWRNDCPHDHRPLEWRQDAFLSADGTHIVCSAHGAHFDLDSGRCFAGPCEGESLSAVPVRLATDGAVWIRFE